MAVVNQSFPIEIHKLVFRNPLQSFNAEPSSPPHTDLYLVENSQTHALLSNPDTYAHRSRTGDDIYANSEPSKKMPAMNFSRKHLDRTVKKKPDVTQSTCLPPGRVLVNISLNDAALEHSYPALSLLSDPSNGIDAGYGLFARRDFSPACPFEDSDLVGYYIGSRTLTVEEAQRYMYDTNPDINTGFMIIFEGLAADGWDHNLGCYTCATALINDPLEASKYNCSWHKE